MKRTSTATTLLALLTLATAVFALLPQRAHQDPLVLQPLDSNKVPGKSPVEICSLTPSDDLVEIKYINIQPNPPLAGKNLSIEAEGVLKVDIEEGAYANFEVKYGFVKLLTGTADLCEKAAEVNLECPIQKGPVKVEKLVSLPSQIPPVSTSLVSSHL
jgi:ML domain